MARRRNHLLWIGPLLAFLGAVSYFTLFARFPGLRDVPWLNLPIALAGVLLSCLALWRAFAVPAVYRGRVLGVVGLTASLAFAGLFATYVYYISYLLPEPTALATGLTDAPDFTLSDHQGRTVQLSDLRGSKVVLVFYRGFW